MHQHTIDNKNVNKIIRKAICYLVLV